MLNAYSTSSRDEWVSFISWGEKVVLHCWSSLRNDILDRFWKTGTYEKKPAGVRDANGGLEADGAKAHEEGCKATLSPAMDILVSSNFERQMFLLAKGTLCQLLSSRPQWGNEVKL